MKNGFLPILAFTLLASLGTGTQAQGGIENLPWGVERIRGDLPWDRNRNLIVDSDANAGQGIRVAVIDTGIGTHPDLAGRVKGGISYLGPGKPYWIDEDGHGTHVAGTMAAIDDGNHLIGVAPRVELYAVRTDGFVPYVVAGIYWSIDHGMHIIVISRGISDDLSSLREACEDAYDAGALLIAAAGNQNADSILYPARYDSVVAVGAVDKNDKRLVWGPWWDLHGSNSGPELELAAPGLDINSTWPFGAPYHVDIGTSTAVPHVAGTAALIWGSKVDPEYDSNGNGQWENSEVRAKLQDTPLDLHPSGRDNETGFGLANAWRSLQRPEGDITRDGVVNVLDLAWVGKYYGKDSSDPNWWQYIRPTDINIDNIINVLDLATVGKNYGKTDP